MRVAFFSPLPPSPTGIADYSADVLALLAGEENRVCGVAMPIAQNVTG